jgi:hypothetical protein
MGPMDKLEKAYKYRWLLYLHYIEIPICRALHSTGLVHSDMVEFLVERWETINRKETLKIIQEK